MDLSGSEYGNEYLMNQGPLSGGYEEFCPLEYNTV
jgi:hypothetical protein